MNRDEFLTVTWNNRLTVLLAIPLVGFTLLTVANDRADTMAGFLGLLLIGAVY